VIHKFNQDVRPDKPYSERDDIIVISDEAHRTQSGRFARNMRIALPNAAFIGFTGTPLFKQDEITKRIFGDYISRYDFKRSEEDGATVKLVYENRGEKLGVANTDLNERIAQKIEEAELNPDQVALLEKLLGKDYEVNPSRMDYQRKYEEIVAGYNQEKDRTTIEETFRRLIELVNSLDEEQKRATREGLAEDELALFDLLLKDGLDKAARERVKQASRELLSAVKARLAELDRFWEKEQTKADVEVFILDEIYTSLPTPPFTADEKKLVAANVYAHIWRQAVNGTFVRAA